MSRHKKRWNHNVYPTSLDHHFRNGLQNTYWQTNVREGFAQQIDLTQTLLLGVLFASRTKKGWIRLCRVSRHLTQRTSRVSNLLYWRRAELPKGKSILRPNLRKTWWHQSWLRHDLQRSARLCSVHSWWVQRSSHVGLKQNLRHHCERGQNRWICPSCRYAES